MNDVSRETPEQGNHRSIGDLGEDIAINHIKKKGWRILARNEFVPLGEIDIIAKTKEGIVVFVEVKTMKSSESLKPEDNMTSQKINKMKRAALFYANKNKHLIKEKVGWRLDAIMIKILSDISDEIMLTNKQKDFIKYSLQHFENVS